MDAYQTIFLGFIALCAGSAQYWIKRSYDELKEIKELLKKKQDA